MQEHARRARHPRVDEVLVSQLIDRSESEKLMNFFSGPHSGFPLGAPTGKPLWVGMRLWSLCEALNHLCCLKPEVYWSFSSPFWRQATGESPVARSDVLQRLTVAGTFHFCLMRCFYIFHAGHCTGAHVGSHTNDENADDSEQFAHDFALCKGATHPRRKGVAN